MGIAVNIPLPARVRHTQGVQGLKGHPMSAAGRVKAGKTSAGIRTQARTGTEEVRRGLLGWEEQLMEVMSMAGSISEGE